MKIVSLVLSLFVLAHLSIELSEAVLNEDKIEKTPARTEINLPMPLSSGLLAIEKKWSAAQQKANLPKEVTEAKPHSNKNKFIIGDNSYYLFGIFREQTDSFALLKSSKNEVIKLKQGDTLPGGHVLTEINTNIIAFVVNNERVEFKLFETKSHAKN